MLLFCFVFKIKKSNKTIIMALVFSDLTDKNITFILFFFWFSSVSQLRSHASAFFNGCDDFSESVRTASTQC